MTKPQDIDWQARAAELAIDGRWLLDGRRQDADRHFDKHSPIDGRHLAAVARCGAAEVDAAVRSAARAQPAWARRSPAARKRVLQAFAEAVLVAREELALLETLDMGKPLRNALRIDVAGVARCLHWYAEAIDKVYGEIAPTGPQALALVSREPVGVVGAIVPWNYPLLMAAWKIAPALAAGNAVVLKPSERSPLSALRLAEIALAAGLPPGLLNVVPGYGAEAGEALALHPGVAVLGFTGSTATGRKMLAYAGRSNLKRVYNELGGKSAFIVFSDCRDPQRAAEACADSLFHNQGQSCNAPTRVLLQRGASADTFTEALLRAARRYTPANPLDWQAPMGTLVDAQQVAVVQGYVEAGQAEGAELLLGGAAVGCLVPPTVFGAVHNGMRIAREEIFGPVVGLQTFEREAEAIELANDSDYGLQAAVWTESLSRAHRVARQLQAGTVHVNQYDEDDLSVPFGGVKASGNGRDKSLHALDKVSELKTTWIRIDEDA